MKRFTAMILTLVLLMTVVMTAPAEGNAILKPGDTGDEVKKIQERLIELGYMAGEASGNYDAATEAGVMSFQKWNNLLVTGYADSVTLALLRSENAPRYEDVAWEEELCEDGLVYCLTDTASMANRAMPAESAAMPVMAEAWDFSTDEYTFFGENGFQSVLTSPLSTFAADVDTSSYAQLRRRVLAGERVPADSVRVEEMLNYFRYDYRQPENGEPFGVTMELADCPWNEETKLLLVGLQAASLPVENRPPMNLVFLIDTSGSMFGADRLDLVKRAFLLLLEELAPTDTVSIVTYASSDRVVLEGTPASEKTRIMEAINELDAYGSTNGSAGLTRAYEIAGKYKQEGGVSRILLATDGDLNVGVTSEGELARLVMEEKKNGIALTCLGFGMGNYKDNKMEALADYGDGNCHYIDSIYEARKALVTEGGGTFVTVAKDVKLQLDFNPAMVSGYRLIGYEDRLLAAEDFADDSVDGGELGSGHRVTALYEIVPVGSGFEFGEVTSKYERTAADTGNDEWLTLSIRAKEPEGTESRLYTYPLAGEAGVTLSDNLKFAAAVAETAQVLRGSEWKGTSSYENALTLLRDCGAVSGDTYKEEFLYLVTLLERAQ